MSERQDVSVFHLAYSKVRRRRLGGPSRPGDEIFGTGTLAMPPSAWPVYHRHTAHYLGKRLRRPTPRVAEGLSVRGLASGGIDISDGLTADLATVYPKRLPLSPALRALDDPDRRRGALAVAGGDDYQLCFTVPPQQRPMLESRWRGGTDDLYRSHRGPGLRWICADGSTYHPPREGSRHFSRPIVR